MPAPELRLPVHRVASLLRLADGTSHQAVVFQAPGEPLEELLEREEPFFPAEENGRVRLYARATLVALGTPRTAGLPHRDDDDLPQEVRAVRVHLRSGAALEGDIRYTALPGRGRTADFLNQTTRTFPVYAPDMVHHVAKAHVLWVEER
jgi:hypothetical protein